MREITPWFADLENLSVYIHRNPLKTLGKLLARKEATGPKSDLNKNGGYLRVGGMSLSLTMMFRSNLKLNFRDENSGVNFITEKKRLDNEVHFVTFEGKIGAVSLTKNAIKNLKGNLHFDDWTITDIDNVLVGNHPVS